MFRLPIFSVFRQFIIKVRFTIEEKREKVIRILKIFFFFCNKIVFQSSY